MYKLIFVWTFACFSLFAHASSNHQEDPLGVQTPHLHREPEIDGLGKITQKTIHRLHDRVVLISPFETKPNKLAATPAAGSTAATAKKIQYYGGPVMTQVSAIYVIWYGNWNTSNGSDTSAGQQIIRDALYGLSVNGGTSSGGVSYSGITAGTNTAFGSYTQSVSLSPANGKVNAISSSTIREYTDAYSQGAPRGGSASLSDAGVTAVVKNAITKASGWSNPDVNAIYLVLTSSDVNETSGFCSQYCGWHTYTTSLNSAKTPIKYAFVGNANRCLASCAPQSTSPNQNAGVDGMVSVIAHELEEIVTDPLLSAWYDSTGAENGDKCAWTFGSSTGNMKSATGPYYNVTLPKQAGGNRNYLLQRALAPGNSKCYVDASGNQ